MKKLIAVISTLVIILIIIAWVSFNKTAQLILDDNGLIEETEASLAIKQFEIVQCKFSLFNPEYAFVAHKQYSNDNGEVEWEFLRAYFYNFGRTNLFSSSWLMNYVGSVDIDNATFAEFVNMLGEDCTQFLEINSDRPDEDIDWIYSPYEPEPEKTAEQVESERLEDEAAYAAEIRGVIAAISDDQRKQLEEKYGNWRGMTDEEIVEWGDRIEKEDSEGLKEIIGTIEYVDPNPLFESYTIIEEGERFEF